MCFLAPDLQCCCIVVPTILQMHCHTFKCCSVLFQLYLQPTATQCSFAQGKSWYWRTLKVRTICTYLYFLCIITNFCSVTGSQRTTCMSATYAAQSEPSLKDPWVTRNLRLLCLAASGDWEKYMLLQELIFYCFFYVCVWVLLCATKQQWNNVSTKCLFMFCYN